MSHRILKKKLFVWITGLSITCVAIALLVLSTRGPAHLFAYNYNSGETFFYHIDLKSHSTADLRVLFEEMDSYKEMKEDEQPGLSQSFKTHMQGELAMAILDKSADGFLVAFRLNNPVVTLKVNDQDAALQAEIISTALSIDIFAEIGLQGRVLSVYFEPEVDSLSQNYARSLLGLMQVVLPPVPDADSKVWETVEDDPSGQYIAGYNVLSLRNNAYSTRTKNDLKSFRKKKIRYLTPEPEQRPGKSSIPKEIEPEGFVDVLFNVNDGYLESLKGTENNRIKMAGKKVADVENSFSLKFIRKEMIPSSELSAMREANEIRKMISKPVPLYITISEEERERAIHRNELGKETFDSLLTSLEKAETEGKKRDTSLYLKFKALVYLHPEVCDTLSKRLIVSSPTSLSMRIISNALSSIGHSQAQQALVDAIFERHDDTDFVRKLVQNLSLVNTPIIIAENLLHDLATNVESRDIQVSAILGLGNMARNLADISPERSDRIIDWLIELSQSSIPGDRIRLFLLALGNSGSIRALPTFVRFFDNSSPALRGAAVTGLRWIDSDKADALITEALTDDSSAAVRSDAVFALSFRNPTLITFEAQKKAFLEDKSEVVRLAVLKNLWEMRKEFPEICQLVKQAAQKDPSTEVRKAAANILAMSPEDCSEKSKIQ